MHRNVSLKSISSPNWAAPDWAATTIPTSHHSDIPPFRHANVPPFRQGFPYKEMCVTQQVGWSVSVGLFRILKIKIKDDGIQDPSIRAVLLLFHYKSGVWCNSCHVGVSDTVRSWQCHESVVIFKRTPKAN